MKVSVPFPIKSGNDTKLTLTGNGAVNTQKMFSGFKRLEKGQRGMVLNSSTLSLQQHCPIAPPPSPYFPPQHPLQRGGEGLITALSRNWSIFNSSGELTGTSTQWHFTVLSGLKPACLSHTIILTPELDFFCSRHNRID